MANIVLSDQSFVVLWASGAVSVLDTIVISEGRDVGSAVAFKPAIDGQVLSFDPIGNGLFRDRETGSVWSASGLSTGGPLSGERLTVVRHANYFWFAWATFNPDTAIWAEPGR